MENKYYTPSIEEFKVGFRYEFYREITTYVFNEEPIVNHNWVKATTSTSFPDPTLPMIEEMVNKGVIRIKCLDESDIIEAGWKFVFESKSNEKTYKMFDFSLTTYKDSSGIYISNGNDTFEDGCVYFQGDILNYNQLLDVMQMLNIKK
jgi:hypothetical protein